MEQATDKRTKDQIRQALDESLHREEALKMQIGEIQVLLDACRKQEAAARKEAAEEPLAASKIPFRIDFYRTTEKGPLKGIIEYLPTREKKSFKGDGRETIAGFIAGFLPVFAEPVPVAKTTKEPAGAADGRERELVAPRLMERIRAAYQAEMSQAGTV